MEVLVLELIRRGLMESYSFSPASQIYLSGLVDTKTMPQIEVMTLLKI
jgi:hypothetical protein